MPSDYLLSGQRPAAPSPIDAKPFHQKKLSEIKPFFNLTWLGLYKLVKPSVLRSIGIKNRQKFVASLLPRNLLFALFNGETEEEISAATLGRIFSPNDSLSTRSFRAFRDAFVREGERSGAAYTEDAHPSVLHIRYAWQDILTLAAASDPEVLRDLEEKTDWLLAGCISEDTPSDIRQRVMDTRMHSLVAALAILTVIASTQPLWSEAYLKEYGSEGEAFFGLVLGPLANEDQERQLEEKERLRKNNEKAKILFSVADSLFYAETRTEADLQVLVDKCREIIRMRPFVDESICKEAEYLCYRLSLTGDYKMPDWFKPEEYLFGMTSPGGRGPGPKNGLFPFSFRANAKRASAKAPGFCWLDQKGEEAEVVRKTMPESWRAEGGSLRDFMSNHPNADRRLYFFDQDPEKNLEGFLEFLEFLYERPEYALRSRAILRGPTDFLAPMVDTALAPFSENCPRVYIFDEVKASVWQLLGRHPLFYPIRNLADPEGACLRLVILGGSPESEFLVREAFHLMEFEGVSCRIDLVAPDAEKMKERLMAQCPGIPWGDEAKACVPFAKTNAYNVDLDSVRLQEFLSAPAYREDACYFVVATANDRQNLTLALRIREWSIRRRIRGQGALDPASLPPIAFRCRNPEIAHLASQMVVNSIEFGNRWFNNYAIIPFGSRADIFSWNETAGALLEKQAKWLHVQYALGPNTGNADWAKRQSMQRYFRWVYSHESSAASVLALPYRLFEIRLAPEEGARSRLVPRYWSILDRSAYRALPARKELADTFERYMGDGAEERLRPLAVKEHSRWVRYELSRGWEGVSVQEMRKYMKDIGKPEDNAPVQKTSENMEGMRGPEDNAPVQEMSENMKEGTTSYKLYIARFHPCICSQDDLHLVEDELAKRKVKRDFTQNDLAVVRATPAMLRLEYDD